MKALKNSIVIIIFLGIFIVIHAKNNCKQLKIDKDKLMTENKELRAEIKELKLKIENKDNKLVKKENKSAKKTKTKELDLNKTGMWRVRHYVDEFKEKTKQKYVTNSKKILGTFSNSATQDSKLSVDFLINSISNISLQLYEYAGNNPVKDRGQFYSVLIQYGSGIRKKLVALNNSNRLVFDKENSVQIHKAFLEGGTIKFKINNASNTSTEYFFKIKNADFYENAFSKMWLED